MTSTGVKAGRFVREEIVRTLKDEVGGKDFFVTSFSGLGVGDVEDLRKKLREPSARFRVAKRSLSRLALENKSGILDKTTGTVGFAIAGEDGLAVSKILVDFSRNFKTFEIWGGTYEGQVLTPEGVQELALLPSRQELLAKVAGGFNAPVSGFVGALGGIVRKFLYALKALEEKKSQ
ncbi:MAG: 50S ribosomal protein L10 [Candidatus Omnitrophica bacterium]|nr:50S ribosomal protein L10 [Candidatus Omnitrophota bacterium]